MTTVAIDHQIFSLQRVGGISRQFCHLIEEARRLPDTRIVLPFTFTNNLYLRNSPAFGRQHQFEKLGLCISTRWTKRLNRLTQGPALRLSQFDVFHPSYYRDYFSDALDGRPFVLSIVDMIPEMFPDLFASSPHKDKATLIPKAAAIITNSVTTKRDLLRLHPFPPERVHVAHLGAPSVEAPKVSPPQLPDDYVLFVGDRRGYKNFARFAEAMRRIMVKRPRLHLVCAGGGPFGPDDARGFVEAGCRERVLTAIPDEDTLQWLYRKSRLFVFPSWYEGFGLPVLEALAYGCPAALSTADAFREVAGEAALFFDPFDPEAIAEAIERLLDDLDLRARLVARGDRRVRDFSWRRMAEQTVAVYHDVAAEHRTATR